MAHDVGNYWCELADVGAPLGRFDMILTGDSVKGQIQQIPKTRSCAVLAQTQDVDEARARVSGVSAMSDGASAARVSTVIVAAISL